MPELITQTAKLVPYAKRPKQASSFVTAYAYEPMADDPGFGRGNFYAVIEVLVSGRASEEIADLIIDTVGDQYYNSPEADPADPTARFEAAIRATNHELAAHVNRGNAAWIGKLSAVVAVQAESELHIAQSGSGEAFLYRGQSGARITTNAPNRPATASKTFSSIATGQLESGDRILLATPALVHQIPLPRLQELIGQSSPNSAIAEITDLLHDIPSERVAALIIEITTPQLAALKVRSERPNEIHLAAPESPLELAKMAATPLAQNAASSAKKASSQVAVLLSKLTPWLHGQTLKLAARIRDLLSNRRGRFSLLAFVALIILTILGLVWHNARAQSNADLLKRYQSAYVSYLTSQQELLGGQKSTAAQSLLKAQQTTKSLAGDQTNLNHQLSVDNKLPSSEPRSLSALNELISALSSQMSGVISVNPTTIITLAGSKVKASHFEISHGKGYIFDANNNNRLTIIGLTSHSSITSQANTSTLGVVIDTTLSSDNNGIYILTDTPAIWFYSFSADSLTKQSNNAEHWPTSAKAIGSYGTSLYLLADDTVYKYTKTAGGFSAGTPDLKPAAINSGTTLAVDGSVYVATDASLNRYFGGQLAGSDPLPSQLTKLEHLRSTNNAALIIATDPATNSIGVWNAAATTLTFAHQITLSHTSNLYAATYDPPSGLIYVSAGNKLLSFPYRP